MAFQVLDEIKYYYSGYSGQPEPEKNDIQRTQTRP